jgi:hypothetical protein
MSPAPKRGPSADDRWWYIPAVAMLAIAFAVAVRATHDLDWPYGVDAFRDLAQAQTLADTGRLSDPFYRGERAWYSPLGPALVAGLATVTAADVPAVQARLGAYVNLIAPLGLLLLVGAWFGPRASVVALALFLFAGAGPDFLEPTYSPWLFGHNFAPGLFLLTLLAYSRCLEATGGRRWALAALTGAGVGLTLLAHGAPALVFALVAGVHALAPSRDNGHRGNSRGSRVASLTFAAAVGLLVASPFLVPIATRYRFEVLNPRPNLWLAPALDTGSTVRLALIAVGPPWRALLAAIGAWEVARRASRAAAALVFIWAGASIVLVFYSWFGTVLIQSGILLPLVMPTHHFLLSFRLTLIVLAAVGVSALVGMAIAAATRSLRPGAQRRAANVALASGVALFVAAHWASYVRRDAFTTEPQAAAVTYQGEWRRLREWVRFHTTPADVFLAPNDVARSLVSAWGRKVVSVDAFFSNPFVDFTLRDRARIAMDDSLLRGQCDAFEALAHRFRVTHVVVAEGRSPPFAPGVCGLRTGAAGPATVVYCAHR